MVSLYSSETATECIQGSKFVLAVTSEAARIEMFSVLTGLKVSLKTQALPLVGCYLQFGFFFFINAHHC